MRRYNLCFSSFGQFSISVSIAGLFLALHTEPCRAADTVEPFDPGVSDFEMYAGYYGIGRESKERRLGIEAVLGAGVTTRFSAYVVAGLGAVEDLSEPEAFLGAGVFGSPLDTEIFDLDLLLGIALDGKALSCFHVLPGLEMNLDFSRFGFYLRAGAHVWGEPAPDENQDADTSTTAAVFLNPGAYLTVREKHQLLIEYDMGILPAEDSPVEIGGIALGYNLAVSDVIELINQVYMSIPYDGAPFFVGLSTGFVASFGSL